MDKTHQKSVLNAIFICNKIKKLTGFSQLFVLVFYLYHGCALWCSA